MAAPPEPLLISIAVDAASDFGAEPKKVLEERVKVFADAVAAQARIYEQRTRGDSSPAVQFTTSHVSDAYVEVRRTGIPPEKTKKFLPFLIRLVLYLAAAGIGVGGNNLTEVWGSSLFYASLAAGLIMVTILEGRGWKGEE